MLLVFHTDVVNVWVRLCSVWTMVYRLHVDTLLLLLLFVLLFYSSFVKGYFQFDHTKLKYVECRYSDTKIYFGENFCWILKCNRVHGRLYRWKYCCRYCCCCCFCFCWSDVVVVEGWFGRQNDNYFSWPEGTVSTIW